MREIKQLSWLIESRDSNKKKDYINNDFITKYASKTKKH